MGGGLLVSIIIGCICGWIASNIMRVSNGGLLFNMILGILGGALGGFLFDLLQIKANGILGAIICGAIGSCVLIWLVRAIKK